MPVRAFASQLDAASLVNT